MLWISVRLGKFVGSPLLALRGKPYSKIVGRQRPFLKKLYNLLVAALWSLMPGGRPRKDSPYIPRIRVTYRFSPEVVAAIEKVTTKRNKSRPVGDKLHRTDYVETAVRQQLEADGVLKVLRDFWPSLPTRFDAGAASQLKTPKRPKLIHLPDEVAEQLAQAAEEAHVSQSAYVLQLLQTHFKRRRQSGGDVT
jgi:hypothetical protein